MVLKLDVLVYKSIYSNCDVTEETTYINTKQYIHADLRDIILRIYFDS